MTQDNLVKLATSIRALVFSHYVPFQGVNYENIVPVVETYFTDLSKSEISLGIEAVLQMGDN